MLSPTLSREVELPPSPTQEDEILRLARLSCGAASGQFPPCDYHMKQARRQIMGKPRDDDK